MPASSAQRCWPETVWNGLPHPQSWQTKYSESNVLLNFFVALAAV
jgi:hypothetical protein